MDKAQLLAEIIELTAPPEEVGDGEFSVSDFAAAAGISHRVAQNRLSALVQQGLLTRRDASQNGKPCGGYRKAEATNDPR